MSEERALYGLIATAQEQQKVTGDHLSALAKLEATIEQANAAVKAMQSAGDASAIVIAKATHSAVEKALQGVFEGVSAQARDSLSGAAKPAVVALQAVTERALQAEQELRDSSSWLGWKWAIVLGGASAFLLVTIVGLSMLLVPSMGEIAKLRAAVADLEARGGKAELSICGDKKRLCVLIDPKQFADDGVASTYGKGEKWMILKGY